MIVVGRDLSSGGTHVYLSNQHGMHPMCGTFPTPHYDPPHGIEPVKNPQGVCANCRRSLIAAVGRLP